MGSKLKRGQRHNVCRSHESFALPVEEWQRQNEGVRSQQNVLAPVDARPVEGHTTPMRAALLDGSPSGHDGCRPAVDALRRSLSEAGYVVEDFSLADLPMAPCRGCFACWVSTPGRCPVADTSEMVTRGVIGADLAVLFSPLSFGCWHSTLKKALDRMIGLLSPSFDTSGLTRHKPRYRRYPAMLGVGWLPGPEPVAEALFARLVEHNAYNLRAPAAASLVLMGNREWSVHRTLCLSALGRVKP